MQSDFIAILPMSMALLVMSVVCLGTVSFVHRVFVEKPQRAEEVANRTFH